MRARAIVLRREPPPSPALLTAQLRLAGLVAEVSALEERVASEARELAWIEARWREATGEAADELERSRQLLRKARRLAEEVARLDALARAAPVGGARRAPAGREPARQAGGRRGPARREVTGGGGAAAQPATGARSDEAAAAAAEAVAQARRLDLKALHRRLARALHPDLSRSDGAERLRRSHLMARANDAYARGDLAELQLLAERVGAAEAPPDAPERERLAHLARRIAAVEASRATLLAAGDRLARSPAARVREEVARRATEGGDAFDEARAAAEGEARAAREEALLALDALAEAARAVPGRWAARASSARRRAPAASPAVRGGQVHLAPGPPSAAARALARSLEERAHGEAWWEVALTLLAFASEVAGRPPPALASASALRATWDALRTGHPAAPDLGAALARLPRGLELGVRRCGAGLEAGLQLASADLGAGVLLALRGEPVRSLACRVLAAAGPRARCRACRAEVEALHLLRLGGPEEVHGLVCSRCGAVLRSFWRFGEPGPLEALLPLAIEVGLLAEVRLQFAGARFALQMPGRERERLTARGLARRFLDVCLAPAGVAVRAAALQLRAGGAPLAPSSPVPADAPLTLHLREGPPSSARTALASVRRHARARFRA